VLAEDTLAPRKDLVAPRKDNRLADLVAAQRVGWSLDRPFYTDEEIYRLDLEAIFKRYWLYAGHASRIPRPGDYFTYQVGDEPLIVIRGADGEVNALYNVCRHRGSLVCLGESGHVKKLACPYHQWIYETDGRLAHARHMPAGFDKTQFGLDRAHARVFHGHIFVSLAETPPAFERVERELGALFAPYDLGRTKVAHTATYEVASNWKILLENFRECYHCGAAHPEYCRAVAGARAGASILDQENRVLAADREDDTARASEGGNEHGFATRGFPLRPDTWHLGGPYPFGPGFVSQTIDGRPVAPPLGAMAARPPEIVGAVVFPTFVSEISPDYAFVLRFTPLAPTRTEAQITWLVREDAVEGVDYDVERLSAFWKATGEQDWTICANNQTGVNSSRYRPGPYSTMETDLTFLTRWYLDELTRTLSAAEWRDR